MEVRRSLVLALVLSLIASLAAEAQPMPMLAQLGGSLRPNPALNQLNRAVRQPLPALPPAQAQRSDQIWVPDRYFATSVGDISYVPGHWERRINNQEYYAPSLVACTAVGECVTAPAGVRPQAPESRQSTRPFEPMAVR